ncbi:MAG: diacylglycerol/polyprenol kinase family protein [Candidatus Eisenbacteria bacterium]
MSLLPEIRRKAIHLSFILIPLIYFYDLLPKPIIVRGLLLAVLLSIVFELMRLHDARVRFFVSRMFRDLVRRHEQKQLLGSTYLLIAAVLTIELFSKPIAVSALGALVLGDTAAALVGKTIGRVRVLGKTLEGSIACFVVSFLFAWGVVGVEAWLAVCGALTATLFELLPIPLDDNFRIPLSMGYVMKLLGG